MNEIDQYIKDEYLCSMIDRYSEESVIDMLKTFALDAIHDSSIQKMLFKETN